MTRKDFTLKLLGIIFAIEIFQVAAIVLLFKTITETSLLDIALGNTITPAIVILFTALYVVGVLYVCRPIYSFLGAVQKGPELDLGLVVAAQDRSLNLAGYMIGFLYIGYVPGVSLGVYLLTGLMKWPEGTIIYGPLTGLISAFLATPLLLYAISRLASLVVDETIGSSPALATARRGGWRLGVYPKLLIVMLTLVGGITGYMALVGYSQSQGNQHWSYFFLMWLVGMAVSFILALAAGKEISRPLGVLGKTSELVERGKFKEPVRLVSNDEFAEVASALNRMMSTITDHVTRLERVVDGIKGGMVQLDVTVETIRNVSAEQSSGATEQASAVHESSSIAEEIVATARQISERAGSVNNAASSTLEACREGEGKLDQARDEFAGIAQRVKDISDSMARLEDRFSETYKIVEWMEDVAEQTELLSLNASLEAAGAGEEGRRFGVVAEATRRLAARSAEAAGEIRELIASIQLETRETSDKARKGEEKVESGAEAINLVLDSFLSISSFAESTSSTAKEITLSTRQQTTASEELAASIAEVQEVAERVEKGAKEIVEAIDELGGFSRALKETAGTGTDEDADKL